MTGEDPSRPASRSSSALIVAGALLANGLALLGHILLGLPLGLTLAVAWTVALLAVAALFATHDDAGRVRVLRLVGIGLAVGVIATVVYDVAKAALSAMDPSPYNPFEATRIFGVLLVGEGTPAAAITAVGWTFHLVNGATFGCAFACLYAVFGRDSLRRGLIGGIGWGLFLETFQLSLYPGWLSIRFLDEFRQISFLSHVAYGTVLGSLAPRLLRRSGWR